MKSFLFGALGAVILAGGALACEEMTGETVVKARAEFSVRGFSYWSDRSPVTIVWNTGETAGTAAPDENGEWAAVLVAPVEPGTYTLSARQDRADSAPVTLTIDVIGPQRVSSLPLGK